MSEIDRATERNKYQRASVTTVTDKESDREGKSDSERKRERGGVPKQSENKDSVRQRNRERHTERETERFTTVFCCHCRTVYPGLLLNIPTIAQTTSSLDKNF